MSAEQENQVVVCIGHVWIETGQIMLSDPSYVEFGAQRQERWSYVDACDASTSELGAAIIGTDHRGDAEGLGAVCSTGDGDGIYPVFVTYDAEGRTKELCVRFERRVSKVDPL